MGNQKKEEITDHDLIKGILSGNQAAFKELMSRYYKYIYLKARRYVRDHESAEDILQETILRIYKYLPGLEDLDKFRYWLDKMIENLAMDYLKKIKRDSEMKRDYSGQMKLKEELDKSGQESRDILDREENREKLMRLIARLPDKYREILILHYYDHLSGPEIADRLNITLSHVEVRIYRARKLLEKFIKDNSCSG